MTTTGKTTISAPTTIDVAFVNGALAISTSAPALLPGTGGMALVGRINAVGGGVATIDDQLDGSATVDGTYLSFTAAYNGAYSFAFTQSETSIATLLNEGTGSTESFGYLVNENNSGAAESIDVSVADIGFSTYSFNGNPWFSSTPDYATPGSTISLNGLSIAPVTTGAGSTFSVTVSDTAGNLSLQPISSFDRPAASAASAGSGTAATSLTFTGTQSQIDADLDQLQYTSEGTGVDTVTVQATDANGVAGPVLAGVTIDNGLAVSSSYTFAYGVGNYGGQLNDVGTNDTLIGIGVDDVAFTPVPASGSASVGGKYITLSASANGDDSTSMYPDAQTVINEIHANLGGAVPLSDTFYYEYMDDNTNVTSVDKVTWVLNDVTYHSPDLSFGESLTVTPGSSTIIPDIAVDTGLATGETTDADEVLTATFNLYNFPAQMNEGTLSLNTSKEGAGAGGAITSAPDGGLTIDGTIAQINADLQGLTYNAAATPGDDYFQLQVTEGPATTAVSIVGDILVVACFQRGARILTARGETPIEELAVGDLVVTASGAERPVRWIGHRRLDASRHPDPAAVWPVRVRAHAFGEALPRRDLWLSPGHNIAWDGALMPVSALVNGVSVAQIEQDNVEYWHVELDAHDVILAEGLASESYLDCGNRAAFVNGAAFIEAHPDFRPKHWAETCLPLALEGPAVAAARARLLARLAEEGLSVDHEADPHVVVDGRRVEPIRRDSTRLIFVLPAGGADIALRSKTFVPAHTVAESADARELGLCVAALQIDGDAVALERDEVCATGWREAEFADGRFTQRWTTGETPLPAGARIVTLKLASVGFYWREAGPGDLALSA